MALRPMRQSWALPPPDAVPGDLSYRPIAGPEQQLAHADALWERAELHPG